jgi:small-conductance mechanosensitive channel
LAGRQEAGAKLLQRALDRRHGLTIKQFAKAKDEEALSGLWDESVQNGEIPGAYWALLSHPAATEALVKKAFRAVHMLSHLVGAANRADIRRLRQQEEEIAALTEKLNRQQRQLRDGFTSRDETIRRLNDMLIRRVETGSQGPDSGREIEALREVLAEAGRKLEQETARRERLEQRVQAMSAALQKAEAALRKSENLREALAHDLALVENQIAGLLEPSTNDALLDLSGQTVLYVGGRANQIPQLKAIVERTGARLLHHDGGIEHSSALLPGLISRADCLFFPVDCISHDAVATIKRLCRQLEKPYHPLRTASLATLMASLALASQSHDAAMAAS